MQGKAIQPKLFEIDKNNSMGKRVQGGETTSDLIMSAYVEGNADVFPKILELHVPVGSVVADITWGKGVFWRNIPDGLYEVKATDIATGVDCRNLPYDDMSVDCVVLDPPYMEGFYRKQADQKAGSGTHISFRESRDTPAQKNGTPQSPICIFVQAQKPIEYYVKEGY